MQIQKNVSLLDLNTFGLPASAAFFTEVLSDTELQELLRNPEWKDFPKFILGGGSNILLTRDINALVIHMRITGIEKVKESSEHVWLRAGGGEVWHDFVMFCVERGYAGIENLSLIPGTVGAAPMQNIGAYGVEIKDVVETVETVSLDTGEPRTFAREDCRFGYRESIFKHELRGRFVLTAVTFRLHKTAHFRVDYGDIRSTLIDMNVRELTIKAVSEAVIQIRRSKLPDPAQIGNAGSFFKNPEISKRQFDELREKFPSIPGYFVAPEIMKVPAGWLIEQAGWKGVRDGAAGVHDRQALVIVNHGGATGQQISRLSEKIRDSVFEQFGIQLSVEVNFI
jgi:UDP-N-acetylmuramate dehydrogenase